MIKCLTKTLQEKGLLVCMNDIPELKPGTKEIMEHNWNKSYHFFPVLYFYAFYLLSFASGTLHHFPFLHRFHPYWM